MHRLLPFSLAVFVGVAHPRQPVTVPATLGAPATCPVVGITDGDTLRVRCPQGQIRVRVAEIDAPERRQPWGERARQHLAELCFGRKAELVPATTDRYGRTVARVACAGVDAGEAMVSDGYAWRYTPYSTTAKLGMLEAEARMHRRGLWTDAKPVPPWTWRHPVDGRSAAAVDDGDCHIGPRGGRYTLTVSGHKRYGC